MKKDPVCTSDITFPPKSVNVSLHGEAEFTCTAIANTFVWKANDTELKNSDAILIIPVILLDEVQGIRMSTLRMTVSSTDSVNITCNAISLSPLSSDESEPALMMVQGRT